MQNFQVFTQVDRQISNFAYCMKKTFYGKQEGLYVKTRNRFFGLGRVFFSDMKTFSLAKCLRITHITLSDRCPPFVLTLMGYHPTLPPTSVFHDGQGAFIFKSPYHVGGFLSGVQNFFYFFCWGIEFFSQILMGYRIFWKN